MKLDIIIPCYNSKDTLGKTLSSICLQENHKDFTVYLVNDCSDYDYSFFINFFSNFINIKELKTKKNIGPGGARNLGIDKSNNEYIIFIDSDDNFATRTAVKDLYNRINNSKCDVIISNFIYSNNGKKYIKREDIAWLHGKIYRRKFLDDNKIRFNNTRANEDNGFNRLIILLSNNIEFYDKITYIYNENLNSITRKNDFDYTISGLEGLTINMNWAIKEALKRGIDKEEAILLSINTLIAMYNYYNKFYNKYDVSNIIKWSVDTKKLLNTFKDIDYEKYYNEKKEELKKSPHIISFKEFLSKIDNYKK